MTEVWVQRSSTPILQRPKVVRVCFQKVGLFRRGLVRRVDGFEREVSRGILFQLLDFQLGFGQLGLADFCETRAFLIPGHQRLQRQVAGLHCLDDRFQLFQSLLKRQVLRAGGLGCGRFDCFRHNAEIRTSPGARLADCRGGGRLACRGAVASRPAELACEIGMRFGSGDRVRAA